jgi:hypothetical protein
MQRVGYFPEVRQYAHVLRWQADSGTAIKQFERRKPPVNEMHIAIGGADSEPTRFVKV